MNLTPDHFSALNKAICSILSSPLASETYAQIVDGLPTCDVYKDYYGWYRIDYETNLSPSKEAAEIVAAYRGVFNLGTIYIDGKVPLLFVASYLISMLIVFRLHNRTKMHQQTRESFSYAYYK